MFTEFEKHSFSAYLESPALVENVEMNLSLAFRTPLQRCTPSCQGEERSTGETRQLSAMCLGYRATNAFSIHKPF